MHLSEQNATGSDSSVGSHEPAGAPAEDEIEVTPAMIEAGVDVLSGFDPGFDTYETAVAIIYEAMEAARRSFSTGH
jgi:hypothetical protein